MKPSSVLSLLEFSPKQLFYRILLLTLIGLSTHTFSLAQWQVVYTSDLNTHYDVNHGSYGGGQWVTVGSNGAIVTSPDGINWTLRSSGTTQTLTDVAYNGTQWVAVGLNGTILTSPDGITWTPQTSGSTQGLTDVGYNAGLWVAVGGNGTILNSVDGINWTSTNSGTSNTLYGITYGGGLWMTIGDAGTVLTSTNGINWTSQSSSGFTQDFRNVGYGGGLWIIVGGKGTILTSPDGINWTQRNAGLTSNTLYGISFDGSTWVIVGAASTILVSTDGLSWRKYASPIGTDFYGVSNNGGKWVAVGLGAIIYSTAPGSGPLSLPVSLVSFQAESEASTAHLTWETAWEKAASHFLVERSQNAKTFEPIGRVLAQGTTTQQQSYRFLDENLAAGLWYYRLRQVDQDGSFTNSQIIAVRIGTEPLETLTLSPNPSPGLVTVEARSGIRSIRVYSTTGGLIQQQRFTQPVNQWQWESAGQAAGLYLIQVQAQDGTVRTMRWVKQ